LFFWLDRRQRGKTKKHEADIEELGGIREDYKHRFGASMSSLATLEAKKEELGGAHHEKETLQDLANEDQDALNQLGVQVEGALSRLGVDGVDAENWSEAISAAELAARELDRKISQLQSDLSGFGVDPSDYVEEDPGISYQKTQLEDLSAEEREIDDALRQTTADLDSLKQRICQETKDDISTHWEALLENLREHRRAVADEYRSVTADILGKILVHGELEILREQEDQKIQRSLERTKCVTSL
jgi:predicted  nucleic acid-binding Zn-ribbon protein